MPQIQFHLNFLILYHYNNQQMSLRGSPIRRLDLFGKDNTVKSSENAILTVENQKLNALVHTKNLQIKQLLDENKMLKLNYEDEIESYKKTIGILQKQLVDVEMARKAEFKVIKEKYDKMQEEETENIKNYHTHQIEFLLKEVAYLRADMEAKQEKILLKDKQFTSMKQSYEREIEEKIGEINNLNRNLLAIEDYKNKQIKQLSSKRELERSRTSGIVSSRKQNNQFMDKQLRNLNQEVLEKAIKIQNLTRQFSRLKRKSEETEKNYTKKIDQLLKEKQDENRERQEHFAKIQKALKDELIELRAKQIEYMGQIDRQKDQIQCYLGDIKRNQQTIQGKDEQIKGYKQILERQRDEHAKEISNLMERKKKSTSRIGSSRSLNSSYRGNDGISEEMAITPIPLKQSQSVRLPIVREESPDRSPNHSLQRSSLTQQRGEDEDNELAKAVYHYDTLIEELKRSHYSEIELLKHKINKISKNLQEKQQELLDILTRFSPLVKIHAQEKTIEQDRKERIERHWKGDLGLLEILLKKYRIKTYE